MHTVQPGELDGRVFHGLGANCGALDKTEAVHCSNCGALCVPEGITTGYGVRPDGSKLCFQCGADWEKKMMVETGKATLYLSQKPEDTVTLGTNGTLESTTDSRGFHTVKKYEHWEVTDWPGKLRFTVD